MDMQKKRNIVIASCAAVILAAIVYGFMPRPSAVDTAAAVKGPLRVSVEEQGKTQVRDRFVISAPVSGFLRRIELHADDPVEPGMALAVIEPARSQALDPRSRAEAEAACSSAESRLLSAKEQEGAALSDADYASKRLERLRSLHAQGSVAKDTFDQAESEARRTAAFLSAARAAVQTARSELMRAQRILGNYGVARAGKAGDAVVLSSPVAGRILRIHRESEGSILAGEPVMEIGDPANLEVRVEVLSSDAVKITKGTKVVFERWGGQTPLQGVVRVVEPGGFTKVSSLGVEEQRVVVLVDIATPSQEWKGLGDAYRLDAGFIVWEGVDVLQVPSSAVFRSGSNWAVYAVTGGRARLTAVKTGHTSGVATEIVSGLVPGDMVITHPDDTLRDGTRVQTGK